MGANPIWQAEELARFLHCPRRVYLDRRAGRHPAGPELAARAAETRARLQAGAAVVEEAVLTDGRLTARFPCLEREAGASRLGSFRYRPRVAAADGRDLVDGLLTALAGLPLLTALQGAEPAIRLAGAGGGEVDFDPARGRAFVHWARQRLEAFLAAGEEPYPHPVAACAACPWQAACRARREGDDHLSLVAGIRPRQIRLLEVAGIRTVAGLAASGPETRVPGLGRATLERLRLQARLQLEARRRGSPVTVVLPAEPGRGLARLPAPAPGDLGAGVEEQPGADGGVRVTAVWWGRLNAPAQVSRTAGEEGHLFRVLAEALAGLAAAGGDLARRHPALWAVLTRQEPRFRGLVPGQPLLQPGESPQAAARRLALLLDHSYLVVQGPPGTGKTWTGAALVVDLLRAGRRVGVMAHSHQVVAHLLEGVAAAAAGAGLSVPMLQKVSGPGQAARVPDLQVVTAARRVERALRDRQPVLVGGTAWLFARRALTGKLDVLVMDEAGQLSLADALAAGQAADALILLGDPRQLNQPVQGSHPPGAAVSVLEHLLEGRPIVPPERGIFLDESRRLHPDLAGFLSRWVYEGRLRAHPACAGQAVGGGKPWAGTGLRFVPVAHHGRRTASPEEGEVVARLWQALVGRPWRGRSGRLRRLGPEDVLVVAPFNAQVTLLQHLLPPGARVGTVDKFQGQEAPVVLYSLAASSLEDLPRGAEFLFSLNRLNVAVSRAQALAVLVANPGLLTAAPPGLEALALMNTVAALVLEATVVPPEATGP
ncbi:protein of unknown function [Candidatus Hydrogenisulfobacillus filiaventi]|uniref:DNA2/NAM7 helicase-like C-terminal domain-containing protein n=1 Tax=Candidatus Hydrogenisulfobacillus filiaventi TaxID=2707344 RepID=A0A6F8ZDN6_9FIRM|nr:protein of unknown function [Candidatus Hydrogenisulfobacillus filiaventi]